MAESLVLLSGFHRHGYAFRGGGMYPNLLISSIDPAFSLSAFNSSSSPLTLKIMLAVALVFVPIVIAYQIWVYRFFGMKRREGGAAAPGKMRRLKMPERASCK